MIQQTALGQKQERNRTVQASSSLNLKLNCPCLKGVKNRKIEYQEHSPLLQGQRQKGMLLSLMKLYKLFRPRKFQRG